MNREPDPTWPVFLEWLSRADHEPVHGWDPEPRRDELRCDPELIGRLAEIARPVSGTARRFVTGRPVIHHAGGRPIAAAWGTAGLAVRSALAAGALASSGPPTDGLAGWIELEPFAPNVAFARAIDLLRAHITSAYELAESTP